MAWLYNDKRSWRLVSLILLGAAALGPWAFDKINVPAQYPCSYRLAGCRKSNLYGSTVDII